MSSNSQVKKPSQGKSANSRPNPAVQSSKSALVHAAGSNPQDQAALKAAVSFAKQHLGLNFDRRTYFDMLSDSMKGYLTTLVNPFELGRLRKTYGVPVAPTVPSRKFACFARGTFSTVPRDTTAAEWGNLPESVRENLLAMTEANSGYLMVSPKLFGVNTTTTSYSRTAQTPGLITYPGDPAPATVKQAGVAQPMTYTLEQQPVVYTQANNKFGCPSRLFEANPTLTGEIGPIYFVPPGESYPIAQQNPGLAPFGVPLALDGVVPTGDPNSYYSGVSLLATNLARMSSNSDVMWWECMPPDPYNGGTSATWSPHIPFQGDLSGGNCTFYSGQDLLTTRKIRLVSCGVRISYIGTEVNRGGEVIGLREPSGLTMASGAYGGILAHSIVQTGLPELGQFYSGGVMQNSMSVLTQPFLYSVPAGYETAPGFRSADWRIFGSVDPAFGCINDKVNLPAPNSSGGNWTYTGAWVGTPFDPFSDDNYGFDQMTQYDQGVPGDVEREWDELVYYPIDPTSAKYEYLYETCKTFTSGRMSSTSQIYVNTNSAVDTPPPPPKLGHFELKACGQTLKAVSVSEASKLLSDRLTAQYRARGATVSQKVQDYSKLLKHVQEHPENLAKPSLGMSQVQFRSDTSGDVTAHLQVSLCDNDWGYSLAWYVRGPDATTAARFKFEVVGHYEIIGRDIRGQTAGTPPDPVGVAAMSAVGHDLAFATTSDTRLKHSVVPAASKVVQAITAQSGLLDKNTKSMHDKIMDAAVGVKSAVAAGKAVKSTFDEVLEFLGPLADGAAALFI